MLASSPLERMRVTLRKWKAVYGIFFQEGLAYRASGVIWIVTDLVTAVTMPLVWTQASSLRSGSIQGFTGSDFVLYYLCMLLVGSFITSHIMWEVSDEIREGKFSNQLLRPFSFAQYTFFRNLSWRVMRTALFLPMFLVILFFYRGLIVDPQLELGPTFWIALVMGHLVSFTSVLMFSMLALFLEEAYSVFELYYVPLLVLSGRMFPVTMLPDWAQTLSFVFPFYYTLGVPTEILIGRHSNEQAWLLIGGQVVWVALCTLIGRALWRRGLRFYSGVGM